MNNSNVNTMSPMDLTEPWGAVEPSYPGKGVGYDWRAVLTEAAIADFEAEFSAELTAELAS